MTRCKTNAPKTIRSRRMCVLPQPAPEQTVIVSNASNASNASSLVLASAGATTTITTTNLRTIWVGKRFSVVEKVTTLQTSQSDLDDFKVMRIDTDNKAFMNSVCQALNGRCWNKHFSRNWVV